VINTSCLMCCHGIIIANKGKVLYGVPRDPVMATAIAQLEEEELESTPDDERPKVCHTI